MSAVAQKIFLLTVLAVSDSHEGKRKAETSWPVFRLTSERSRFIYDAFYKKKEISRDLYEWLLRENYADAGLIARWKKVCSLSVA